MKFLKNNNGSITVEAALAMPLFISAVLVIAFFTRIVYIHGIIQHALLDTANQLALYEYIDKKNILEGKGEVAALLVRPIVLSNIKKSSEDQSVDLSKLMVVGGNYGLNLNGSTLLDENGNVDLKVSYSVRPIISVRFMPDINIFQRAVVKAWRTHSSEDETSEEDSPKESEESEGTKDKSDIWSLPPMTRGRKIQTMLGRNLPDYFPVVDKYEGNKITTINSINLNNLTYRKPINVKNKINGFIKELEEFDSGEYKDKVIRKSDYTHKELIIVFPKDSSNKDIDSIVTSLKLICIGKGIDLKIVEL